jgi:hypothetical protein
MERILLGQLGANGDCLYATILARQLRRDYPRAYITWAISSQCANLLLNNPDINEIWKVPVPNWSEHERMWHNFEREAFRRYKQSDFDLVLLSQIWPNNFQNFDGTVRPSVLRSYGRPITVPIENVICLSNDEIERVDGFVREHGINNFENRILFECSSKSGQSFVTPDLAQTIADYIYALLPDTTVIFLTNLPMTLRDPRSRYAGNLSLRECAALTHHCSLFLGCGSGGTVAASSTASKSLPMMLMLSAHTSALASFAHDFEYFGITDHEVVETTCEDPLRIATAAAIICQEGVAVAREKIENGIPIRFEFYCQSIEICLLRRLRFLDAARSVTATSVRYGWTKELIDFSVNRILPKLSHDASWLFSSNRHFGEEFRAQVMEAEAAPAKEARQVPGGALSLLEGRR